MRLIEHKQMRMVNPLFTDLKIGDYQVEFNLSTIPDNYIVTAKMLEMMMQKIQMLTKQRKNRSYNSGRWRE